MALGNLGVDGVTAGNALPVVIETPVGDTAMDDVNDAVRVNIVAGSASGTQYTEGDIDATITGTALVFEGAADTLVAATGDATNGLDVDVTRLPALVAGTANIGDVDVLTVPAPLSTTGGGTEATALRVTLATDSTGLVSVDDNGANLSIDWAGTPPPIGAGLEATALRVAIATDSTIQLEASTNNIGDVDVLTVPAPLSTSGGGLETTALRVTLASDSTGLVSVDDNGGAITVDWAGVAPPIGAGTEAAALRVAIATDSTIQLEASTNNIGDVDILTIAAGDNNIGNVDVVTLPALVAGSANIGDVDVLTLPVSSTSSVTSVADAATSTQLLAATAGRRGYKLYNDSTQIAYVKEGTTASTTDYSYQLPPNAFYESVGSHVYTGRIDAIWAADASGAMKITELSA